MIEIDWSAVQDVLRKIGVILIAGGLAGWIFENTISALTAVLAIIGGMLMVFIGVLRRKESQDE